MKKNAHNPPRIARWILSYLEHYEKEYSITGDCSEEFRDIKNSKGKTYAVLWIWGQIICAFFSRI